MIISEVFPTMFGRTCAKMEKLVLSVPLNGAVTLLFTGAMLVALGGAIPGFRGSTSRSRPEPLLPAGQAVVVEYVIPLSVDDPEVGFSVTAPGWVPKAACACDAPSTDAPARSAPAPSSTAVRLSRFRRKIGIPFMEGFLSASLWWRARREARRLAGLSLMGRGPGDLPGHSGSGQVPGRLEPRPAWPGSVASPGRGLWR